MRRGSTSDAANRAGGMIARATIIKADDSKKMQEVSIEILKGEKKTKIEHFQNYGHNAVPLPEGKGDAVAEAIVVFIGGNRSHGVVIAVDDRRHRPKNWKPGESGLYDDQKQTVKVSRDGIQVDAGEKKLPITVKCGSATFTVKDGQILGEVGGTAFSVTPGRIDLGVVPAPNKVITEAGPSPVVYAV